MTDKPGSQSRSPGNAAGSEDSNDFLRSVLATLASEDPEAFSAVLRDNPALAELYRGRAATVRLVRRALVEDAATVGDAEWAGIVAETRAALQARRMSASAASAPQVTVPFASREHSGILTSMTRQLSPDKALELYRKIAPLLVFEILNLLTRSTSLDAVHRIAEHLCSTPVQSHLRECEHVRDGIIEELCHLLRDAGIRDILSRDRLRELMEESGVMNDLIAMENCIKLSRTKAG